MHKASEESQNANVECMALQMKAFSKFHRHRQRFLSSSSFAISTIIIASHRHRFAREKISSYRIASATSHFFFIVSHRHRLQNASIVYHRHRLASASFGIGSLASSEFRSRHTAGPTNGLTTTDIQLSSMILSSVIASAQVQKTIIVFHRQHRLIMPK